MFVHAIELRPSVTASPRHLQVRVTYPRSVIVAPSARRLSLPFRFAGRFGKKAGGNSAVQDSACLQLFQIPESCGLALVVMFWRKICPRVLLAAPMTV
jgi:hypothetical protein